MFFLEIMVDSWPMMSSPGPMLCIVGTYLAFVLKVGPKMMEKRPAFQLKNVLILYNAIQVLFSIWLTHKVRFIRTTNKFKLFQFLISPVLVINSFVTFNRLSNRVLQPSCFHLNVITRIGHLRIWEFKPRWVYHKNT